MTNKTPRILDLVVKKDLCTGCGACIVACKENVLSMEWNSFGFRTPMVKNNCNNDGNCIKVCPFNPTPIKDVKNETVIAKKLFQNETSNFHKKIGFYIGLYAGHSKFDRLNSSSGGLATFISKYLLGHNEVDHILNVKSSNNSNSIFEYTICSNIEDLKASAKTRYYPVSLDQVLLNLASLKGKVAVVGIPCHIKSIRLLQNVNPLIKNKIVFTIGIVCGGIKSRFFTEYLAQKSSVKSSSLSNVEFRKKDLKSHAGDYSFSCSSKENNTSGAVKMRTLGDMWGTGLFKANACDFCDDVLGELCDISLGDAWIKPFVNDGKGTNILVTRSTKAQEIIQSGVDLETLSLTELSEGEIIKSQKGSFTHRQECLPYRIKRSKNNNLPPKRQKNKLLSPELQIIQNLRMQTRSKSLEVWKECQDANSFDTKMNAILKVLNFWTKISHIKRKLLSYIIK